MKTKRLKVSRVTPDKITTIPMSCYASVHLLSYIAYCTHGSLAATILPRDTTTKPYLKLDSSNVSFDPAIV